MPISLYDATVPAFLRGVQAMEGVLQRGVDYYTDAGKDPQELVTTSLCDDMLPFSFQIASVAHHSMGALKGAAEGKFGPSGDRYDTSSCAALGALLAETRQYLQSVDAATVNGFEGGDVVFEFGETRLPFTAVDFFLGFSQPNFHFHAATAYDLLRLKGVPLGKRDYLGSVPVKQG